jgi:prepilin-type N-terminal cleavage/methylation domain-containing protein
MQRGFSILEILIAMALLLSALVVTVLLSSTQSVSVDTQTSVEALTLARQALESEQSLARKDFKLVVATTSIQTIGGTPYTTAVTVTIPPAPFDQLFSKQVTATVTWPGTYGRNPSTTLTTLVTNFENAVGGDTCSTLFTNPLGVNGWKTPVVTSSTFATLVGDSNAFNPYVLTDVDASQKRLYVTTNTPNLSPGPNDPASGVDSSFVGTLAWTNPAGITAKDNVNATLAVNGTAVSQYLEATNFGFAIPPGATILGIKVDIYRNASGKSSGNAVLDSQVKLVRADGTVGALNKAGATTWSTTAQTDAQYGGSSDLWSETSWSPAAINSSNFGVVLAVTGSGPSANRIANVDSIQVTVTYAKEFYIFDIKNPTNPAYLGGLAMSAVGGINAVSVATSSTSNYAYVATNASSGVNQLQIINISNPNAPSVVSTYPLVSGSGMGQGVGTSMFYQDGYVYEGLTTGAGGPEFNVIDVSNSLSPQWKGGYTIGTTVHTIVVKDGYAYLSTNDTSRELVILNVTNPASPTLVGTYNATPDVINFGYGRALYTVGDTLYMGRSYIANAPEFLILNTTNATPVLRTTKDVGPNSSNPFSLNGIVARDSLVYLLLGSGTNGGSLQIINATSTATVATVSFPNGTTGVGGTALDCEGNYLYAASVDSVSRGYLTTVTGQ